MCLTSIYLATKLQAFNFATDSVSRTIANRTMEAPTFLPNVKKSNEEFMKKALHGHAKVAPVSKPVTRPLSVITSNLDCKFSNYAFNFFVGLR